MEISMASGCSIGQFGKRLQRFLLLHKGQHRRFLDALAKTLALVRQLHRRGRRLDPGLQIGHLPYGSEHPPWRTLKVHEHRNAIHSFKNDSLPIFDGDHFIDRWRGQAGGVNSPRDSIFSLRAVLRNPVVKQLEDPPRFPNVNIGSESFANNIGWLQSFGGLRNVVCLATGPLFSSKTSC